MLRALLQVVIPFALLVYCLVHCIQAPAERVRNLPKWAWILLIVLVLWAGPIAYLLAGRPLPESSAPGAPRRGAGVRGPGSGPRVRQAPRGPDDDPDFLRTLDRRRRGGEQPPGEERTGDNPTGADGGKA